MKLSSFGIDRPAPFIAGALKHNARVKAPHSSRSHKVRENKNMTNNQENNSRPATGLQRREMPKHDFTQYLGMKAKVASATIEYGQHGPFVKVTTEPVGYLDENKEKPVTASRIFGLATDENGQAYIGIGTKTEAFLEERKLSEFSDLVGQTVIVNGREDKEGRMWLSFI